VTRTRPAPTREPLLPAGRRTRALLAALVGAVVVAVLGVHYAGATLPGTVDTAVDTPLVAFGDGDAVYRPLLLVALLGSPPAMLVGLVLLVLLARRTGRGAPAVVLALAAPVLAGLTTELLLKPLIGRSFEGNLSLPSGHATSITAQVGVALVLLVGAGWLRPERGRRPVRLLVVAALLLAPFAVSFAMVSLERHYATDTAAGIGVGVCVVVLLTLLVDAWTRRQSFRLAEDGLTGEGGGRAA
jgi:membrane-associated phospholipid phosphatase